MHESNTNNNQILHMIHDDEAGRWVFCSGLRQDDLQRPR